MYNYTLVHYTDSKMWVMKNDATSSIGKGGNGEGNKDPLYVCMYVQTYLE